MDHKKGRVVALPYVLETVLEGDNRKCPVLQVIFDIFVGRNEQGNRKAFYREVLDLTVPTKRPIGLENYDRSFKSIPRGNDKNISVSFIKR